MSDKEELREFLVQGHMTVSGTTFPASRKIKAKTIKEAIDKANEIPGFEVKIPGGSNLNE